ncbi:helix-turn-helix domain-containing protein [Mycolicibacterium elephantis]|uniref:TetR/AcrR family transcriptional regulator n=1 Tax=Mycolicibacterium elephantis TaxID=81858 RepID=UPI0006299A72|nr:TetR family transcriptional regulator [Mycolicibacterium elephantis]KKW65806.1 hypothetical protein AAV95_04635 [Mycolicibacterium elephantis]OBB16489.1 hypothetical protein A5762_02485 [Mycolicibacterium elephantis]OBE94941.1 hypothetical protein A5776_21595 [Mycolicibacterium elephantis]
MRNDQQVLIVRPARGTRPRNRRRLIIDAAAELFHQRGYSAVAMSDIAAAVAIGPSALYRHFAGKNDLLATVIEDALTRLDDALRTADDTADIAGVLAGAVLRPRTVGVLWRREAHNLTDVDRKRVRTIAKRIGRRLSVHLRDRRPELTAEDADLLAWCALGVANSISFHNLSLPEPRFAELIAISLQARPISTDGGADNRPATVATHSRREAILAAATTLFAEKGFAATSIDDIGAAVGIAGPSIYSHFEAKTDILVAAMSRGNESLWLELNRAVEDIRDPSEALSRVITSYLTFALKNPGLIEVLMSGARHLPPDESRWARRSQRDYIDEWVHLMRQIHPSVTATEARIRVHACQLMINDVAVMRRLRGLPGAKEVLGDIASALMLVST